MKTISPRGTRNTKKKHEEITLKNIIIKLGKPMIKTNLKQPVNKDTCQRHLVNTRGGL